MTGNGLVKSSLELLANLKRKTCVTCWHHRDGSCALYSVTCATEEGNYKKDPSRWTSYSEGEEIEQSMRRLWLR